MPGIIRRVYPVPFTNQKENLLNVKINPNDIPPWPIIRLDQGVCAINNNAAAVRNYFMLPWLFGLLLTFYWHIDTFYNEWNAMERVANNYIISTKRMLGKDIFQVTEDPIIIRKYRRLDESGQMSLAKYLEERYEHSVGGGRDKVIDIFLLIIYGVGLPVFLIWTIRFPRLAPIYFDRKRRIVYSWRKGMVMAQHYDDMRILEDIQALTFVMRGKLKNGALAWLKFRVQPSENPVYNSRESYVLIKAYVAQFMEYGRDRVANSDYQAKTSFFFRDDKKPEGFDSKLDELLKFIRSVDDEPPLDENGLPKDPQSVIH